MAVTLKNIAERAKVSRPAVSLFLNNRETKHVSTENKKRILKAIDQLGYRLITRHEACAAEPR